MGFWVVAARSYPAADVGKAGAAIAAMTLLQGLSALYLDGVLIRFVPIAGTRTRRLVSSVLGINAALAVVCSLIFLVGLPFWSPRLEFLRANLWIALGFVLLTVASSNFMVQDGALIGLRRAPWVLAKNGAVAVAKIVLLVALAPILAHDGILVSWMIAIVILLVPSNFVLLWKMIPAHHQGRATGADPILVRDLGSYALGNYVAALLNTVSSSVLPLIVLHVSGSQANAHFYLPWTISLALRLIPTNMSSSLIVEGTMDRAKLVAYSRQAMLHTARQMVPVVTLLFLIAPYLLRIFGAGYATDGATLLRLLALAAIPNIVNVLYIGYARVLYRVVGVVVLQGGLVIASLGLSYLWLPDHGIVGVGVAWLVSQSAAAAILLLTQLRPMLRRAATDTPIQPHSPLGL